MLNQLFKQAGYLKEDKGKTVITYSKNPWDKVRFCNNQKTWTIEHLYKEINLDLTKAIFEKIKELKWLDDRGA